MPATSEDATITCPKCQSQMASGFIPDFAPGGHFISAWHEGQPRKSFWGGLKLRWTDVQPIRAFRCANCGYLEFYADKQFAAT